MVWKILIFMNFIREYFVWTDLRLVVKSLEKLGRSCVTLSRPSVLEKRWSILC